MSDFPSLSIHKATSSHKCQPHTTTGAPYTSPSLTLLSLVSTQGRTWPDVVSETRYHRLVFVEPSVQLQNPEKIPENQKLPKFLQDGSFYLENFPNFRNDLFSRNNHSKPKCNLKIKGYQVFTIQTDEIVAKLTQIVPKSSHTDCNTEKIKILTKFPSFFLP